MSSAAAEKLRYQKDNTREKELVDPTTLLGTLATAPGIERKIPILPASFVSAQVGSGIVTSVPSDAPFDYVALQELRHNESLRKQLQRWNVNLALSVPPSVVACIVARSVSVLLPNIIRPIPWSEFESFLLICIP